MESTDVDIALLFLGNTKEQEAGLDALMRAHTADLIGVIRCHLPGLTVQDAEEVVSTTFQIFWRKVQDETVDLNRPLRPLLRTIAHRRATDLLRSKTRHPESSLEDDACTVADAIKGTDVSLWWRKVTSQDAADEVRQIFVDFIQSLPPVQQAVAQVMADNFPDDLSQEETAKEIFRRTGNMPTVVSIKKARSEIRDKFESILKARIS